MAAKKPAHIKDIIHTAIASAQDKNKSHEELRLLWQSVAGKEALRHSFPQAVINKKFIIHVDSPVWIYQLNMRKQDMEKQISAKLKQNLRIIFRAGEQ